MIKDTLIVISLILFSTGIKAETIEDTNSVRFIIGFYSDSYHKLGGAVEACEYINKHTQNNQPISLVRPLGNGAILVHINQLDASQLEMFTKQLLTLEKVRYVEIDGMMNPLNNRSMGTIPLR